MEWQTDHGVIREEILKMGLHDVVMGYPVITMAVMRHFEDAESYFQMNTWSEYVEKELLREEIGPYCIRTYV
jgi:hypothetical protein